MEPSVEDSDRIAGAPSALLLASLPEAVELVDNDHGNDNSHGHIPAFQELGEVGDASTNGSSTSQ